MDLFTESGKRSYIHGSGASYTDLAFSISAVLTDDECNRWDACHRRTVGVVARPQGPWVEEQHFGGIPEEPGSGQFARNRIVRKGSWAWSLTVLAPGGKAWLVAGWRYVQEDVWKVAVFHSQMGR